MNKEPNSLNLLLKLQKAAAVSLAAPVAVARLKPLHERETASYLGTSELRAVEALTVPDDSPPTAGVTRRNSLALRQRGKNRIKKRLTET